MKEIKEYTAIKKFPVMDAYLQHFSQTSMNNEIPGLLSFFFIQGQLLLPYVRIPTGDNHLDPRVHVFWIQPSRTGKSIAWNFISDIMDKIGVNWDAFASGTDAGLIGSNKQEFDEHNKPTGETIIVPGLLAGQKAINFDEGSILLTPNKHSQETVLYLQTACNAVGSKSNILVKHMKGDKVECESRASLWITTYPPKGVKDYVLTKGIFQRVLLYWKHWDMDMRQEVSNTRLGTFFQRPEKNELSRDDICDYFTTTEKRVRDRLLNLAEINFTQWSEMDDEEKEEVVQKYMWDMFTPDTNYQTSLYNASDAIYANLGKMSASMAEIVSSFTPGIENYLGIISLHMAVLDESWEIKEKHVDMAFEILNDLFINLIQWLESSVEVDSNKNKENKILESLTTALNSSADIELEGHGGGWRKKLNVKSMYMEATGVSNATAERHLKDYAMKVFTRRKSAGRVHYRLKGMKKR
tara:strand:+ start:200 stop:1603 length:1404 start_codon:yes stop_codon:yes gene_type:complete